MPHTSLSGMFRLTRTMKQDVATRSWCLSCTQASTAEYRMSTAGVFQGHCSSLQQDPGNLTLDSTSDAAWTSGSRPSVSSLGMSPLDVHDSRADAWTLHSQITCYSLIFDICISLSRANRLKSGNSANHDPLNQRAYHYSHSIHPRHNGLDRIFGN